MTTFKNYLTILALWIIHTALTISLIFQLGLENSLSVSLPTLAFPIVLSWAILKGIPIDALEPNSPENLRERARQLARKGFAIDNPYVSVLVKQALVKEKRGSEIPSPNEWEMMSPEDKEDWVLKHLGGKL